MIFFLYVKRKKECRQHDKIKEKIDRYNTFLNRFVLGQLLKGDFLTIKEGFFIVLNLFNIRLQKISILFDLFILVTDNTKIKKASLQNVSFFMFVFSHRLKTGYEKKVYEILDNFITDKATCKSLFFKIL